MHILPKGGFQPPVTAVTRASGTLVRVTFPKGNPHLEIRVEDFGCSIWDSEFGGFRNGASDSQPFQASV